MGLLNLERIALGEVGIKPGSVKMVTTDNLATITAAGYLNGIGSQIPQVQLAPSDIIECLYSYNASTDSGTLAWLTVSISSGVITLSETSGTMPLTDAHIFVGNSGGVATDVAVSGDLTLANTGAFTIANSAVTNAKVAATAGIDFSKLAALNSGNILVGNASNVATSVAMSGDVTISNAGVTALASNLLQYASVAITAAEFNGMYATPKLIIAAPGANNLIVIERAALVMTFVSAQYVGGGVVALQYDSTIHGAGVLASNGEQATDFSNAAASTAFQFNGASGNASEILFTSGVNKGIYLSNDTAAFTTGDSTFQLHVWYKVIATV